MIGGERQPSVDTVMSTADAMEAAEAVTDSGFCTWKDMHMEGYASPLGKRKHSRDLTEPPIATAPSAEPNKKDETTDEELAECLDKILTLAYEMDRKIKEAAEDATMPGDAGRCAILTGRRARRKSAQLQQDFAELMGDKLEACFKQFDEDGNGTLEPHELAKALAAAGRPSDDDTVAKSIAALDKDGDGLISLEEFKAIAWTCATN